MLRDESKEYFWSGPRLAFENYCECSQCTDIMRDRGSSSCYAGGPYVSMEKISVTEDISQPTHTQLSKEHPKNQIFAMILPYTEKNTPK